MEVVTQADSMIAAKAATVARSKNIGSPPCLLVPAAVADALMTLLTYVIARNARDPAMMAAISRLLLTMMMTRKQSPCRTDAGAASIATSSRHLSSHHRKLPPSVRLAVKRQGMVRRVP